MWMSGTSGGVWGLENGYSIMVGGDDEVVARLRPIFETLAPAPDKGWGHVGPSGAGHFTKMVHNGIEYGMMQAYGEGFALMNSKTEFNLDLHQVAEIWRDGSVVQSWLLDLTAAALAENPDLEGIAPYVPDSGEGRWTVAEAIDLDVAAPVITLALLQRLQSRDPESFSNKLLSALRNQFGGHDMKKDNCAILNAPSVCAPPLAYAALTRSRSGSARRRTLRSSGRARPTSQFLSIAGPTTINPPLSSG